MTANDLANASRCYCFTGSSFQEAFLYLASIIAAGSSPVTDARITEEGDTRITEEGDTRIPET